MVHMERLFGRATDQTLTRRKNQQVSTKKDDLVLGTLNECDTKPVATKQDELVVGNLNRSDIPPVETNIED